MKKKLFALAITLGAATGWISATDGTTFYTEQNQAIAIETIQMIVAADSQETFNVMLTDGTTVSDVLFLVPDNLSGVASVTTGEPQMLVADATLRLSNCPSDTQVTIYSANGMVMMQQTVNGNASLNIEHLQPGVYVLQAGKATMKFIKH